MREHSNVIRKFQTLKMLDKMEENPVFNIDGTNRLIIVTICRIRQRILTQAWRILTQNTGVNHDFELDARVILSRKLPEDELRTELEIEILFKWIYNTKDIDPTGIANTIYLCKKRSAVYVKVHCNRCGWNFLNLVRPFCSKEIYQDLKMDILLSLMVFVKCCNSQTSLCR